MRKLFFILCVSILFSCQPAIETNRITVNLTSNPNGLNPVIYFGQNDNLVCNQIFSPLASHDPVSLEFSPVLAKKLSVPISSPTETYPEAIRFDIEIRDDAEWQDGSSVDGYDVAFTLKSIFLPSSNTEKYRSFISDIYDVKVDPENPKSVSIYLKKLSMNATEIALGFPIMDRKFYDKKDVLKDIDLKELIDVEAYAQRSDKEALDAYGELFSSTKYSVENVSGSGPYKVQEWLNKQYVILEKKEDYWGDGTGSIFFEAKPKEIQMIISPDKSAAFSQLKAGAYDIYSGLSSTQWNELHENETYSSQYNFVSTQLQRYYFFILNSRRKKLEDVAVRKALAHLANVDSIIAVAENGVGERINSPFLSIDKYSTLKDITFNKNYASEILAEAGWKDSNNNNILDKEIDGELVELEIKCASTGSQLGQILTGVLSQNAEEVGIKIEVENMDRSVYQKRLKSNDFDMTISAKGLSLMPYDPYSLFHTDNTDNGESNLGNFGNEKSDELIERIRSTVDEEKRKDLYLELEKMIYNSQNYIFLYSPKNKMVIKKDLEGVTSVKLPGFEIKTFERTK